MLLLSPRKTSDCKPRPRWWTTARKGAATAAVAGIVAVSLVVAEPAHSNPVLIAPAIVEGAVEVAAGGLAALTPIGWGVVIAAGVASLAVGAYETRDTWYPWISGQYGSGDNSKPSGAPASGGATVLSGLNLSNVTLSDANTFSTTMTWNASQGSFMSASVAYVKECQYPLWSHIGDANGNYTQSGITTPRNLSAPVNIALPYVCKVNVGGSDVLGTPVAFKAGLPGTDGLPPLVANDGNPTSGPANEVMYGAFKSGQFDPKDPNAKYTASVQCIDSFGVKSTITADSFGNQGGVKMPSCAAAGKGHGTGVSSITGYPPGSPAGTVIYQTTWTPDPAKPLCDPGLASGGCMLSVSIDGKPCVVGDVQCENWINVDKNDSTHTRVSCNQGPYVAVLSACFLLERAYYPGGAPANDANTDGDPGTSSNTDLNGNPMPTNTPVQTGTVPGGAGEPAPAPAGAPAPAPLNNPQDCWPSGWGVFNPLEWVYKPLNCFFTPQKPLQARVDAVNNVAKTKAPFSWMTGAGVMVAGAAAGATSSGCPNWVITVGSFSQNIVCNSPFINAIVSSRPLFLGAMTIAMFWPLIRSLWYAAIPLVRPVPIS